MPKSENKFRQSYFAENSVEGDMTEQNWSCYPQNDFLCHLEIPVTVTIFLGSQFLDSGIAEISGSHLT